ncbi:hypothetical protein [Adhaeribacter aquaticus]|uniref:hypothetical protein n=1 Tax=Adhaeribacter aquaticus TaxID=299567 RepID=UPI000404CCD3|nr:hypothetical protein [Adhaeribacter aquaticus]
MPAIKLNPHRNLVFNKLRFYITVAVIAGIFGILSFNKKARTSWTTQVKNIGTFSSARAVDLNKDGTLDIVIGAGAEENYPTDIGAMAIDGKNGKILWQVPGVNQFVGSAALQDITGDAVPDIFIGGRWAELVAINGATGKVIWRFLPDRENPDPGDTGWFNFTTPQFIPDQDNDGHKDLLVANGGDARIEPYDPDRPVGRLLVFSSKTGKILADARVPDGKETYMSVVCSEAQADGQIMVLFGTGGETLGGHLFRTTLQDIMRGDLSKAKVLATNENKGFVAPPIYADINLDGIYDIVTNAVDGQLLAIDGKTDGLLWQVNFPGTEVYSMPAVGYFNNDSIPDFFTSFAAGVWPLYSHSIRFMVDGKTGKVMYQDKIKGFQNASPVVADLNGDGLDEAIVNQGVSKPSAAGTIYNSHLLAFDFKRNRKYAIGDSIKGNNIASTPWIGDLDNDNYLDIIYNAGNFDRLSTTLEFSMARHSTKIKIKKPVIWGAYLGSDYSSVFRCSPKTVFYSAK